MNARLLLVGEAPGKEEEEEGEPFIGAAGRFLWEGKDWHGPTSFPGLRAMGFRREEVRIENVVETRPPENSLLALTPKAIEGWQESFWVRLEQLRPTVIVPVGNLALNTLRRTPLPLTKRGKWRAHRTAFGQKINWTDKISQWRGSVFNISTLSGRKVKCIPTYHPSFMVRGGEEIGVWQADWERIAEDQLFPELRLDPSLKIEIDPTEEVWHRFRMLVHQVWRQEGKKAILAVDIETIGKGRIIDCIGFCVGRVDGGRKVLTMTIPLQQQWQWAAVRALLKHPIRKAFHYGLSDVYVLRRHGVEVANPFWDTHQLHHMFDPRAEHRLATCASRDLRVRYWKFENKEDRKGTVVKNPRRRMRYNGKDVGYTWVLAAEKYVPRMRELRASAIYRDHYRRLTAACLALTLKGMRTDDEVRAAIERRERDVLADLRRQMHELAGVDLVAKNGLSSPKVQGYFYETLKCKPFYRRGGGGSKTADEVTVRKLMSKYKKARPMGHLVLQYRQHAKLAQEVRPGLLSDDGRMRSRYSPTTDTGRLRAAKVTEHEGINAQNRDRTSDLRRMFIPEVGQLFLEVDQKQAEACIVDGMSGDPQLLKVLRDPTIDRHVLSACRIFPEEEYASLKKKYKAGDPEAIEKRQLGKRVRHAAPYGMEGTMMAEMVLKDTEGKVVLDPDECTLWLGLMRRNEPGLVKYQEWISRELVDTRRLVSSWGRWVLFNGLRISKEDHKAAWAWRAQHEVGVITNQLAFVPLHEALEEGRWQGAQIAQQGHDSLLTSTPKGHAWEIAVFLAESIGVERVYPGAAGPWTYAMQVEVKMGKNWKDMVSYEGDLNDREGFERWINEKVIGPC